MKGLFVNSKRAKDSIYESGYMVYRSLKFSSKFDLDYVEIDANEREISTDYDFYVFNYHMVTMQWLQTGSLRKNLGFCITIILEVAPNDPFVYCSSKDFDAYCVLDPTLKIKNKKVYAFPRPLEKIAVERFAEKNDIPVIGSFGFATKGKGFHHVVEAVNKEFDKAVVRINIPHGDFVPDSNQYAQYLSELCRSIAKPGIEVLITHEFMTKEMLVKWCSENTLNCFLYDRNIPGLAATTDQAIVSGRPLAVSKNDTFRHILNYLLPYPEFSLRDSISKSGEQVARMQHDWSPEKFAGHFEFLLDENLKKIKAQRKTGKETVALAIRKNGLMSIANQRIKKYKRKIMKFGLNILSTQNDTKSYDEII
jgi:hypothetical protein